MDSELPVIRASAVVLEFPAADPASPASVKIPRRIRRRLLEARTGNAPASVEEIEAKLKEADLRRQQFHEWLSNKAKPKPRSPSWLSQEDDLGQRLEAKLYAAEQKRLSLLAKAQTRLARLDELRQAAKTELETRYKKEREELVMRVESRVQKAEANRMCLLKNRIQRLAEVKERKDRSSVQRMSRENKYKECIRSAICQKRIAAEKKRLSLLAGKKTTVHARVLQVDGVAKKFHRQRESKKIGLKEQSESRLQMIKRHRAEHLRQRGISYSTGHIIYKDEDLPSRKIARCWRQFVGFRRTTLFLTKSFEALELNEKVAKSMTFEQLAIKMESAATLQAVNALFDRFESRLFLCQHSRSSNSKPENIDYLLKRLASPITRTPGKSTRTRGVVRNGSKRELMTLSSKLSRYPVRVVLCSYMILGHPNAVFSERGERELELWDSAANFIKELELLIRIILDPCSLRQSSSGSMCDDDSRQESPARLPNQHNFRSQLSAFDSAWRAYLYAFVVWKVKDARSIEDDLVRTACQLELSMLKKCKLTSEGQTCNLTPDLRAIQEQVTEDHKLIREKVLHLGGSTGLVRMESALLETRSKFFQEKVNAVAVVNVQLASPSIPSSSAKIDPDSGNHFSQEVYSLSGNTSSPVKAVAGLQFLGSVLGHTNSKKPSKENEILVNEIIHGGWSTSAFNEETDIKAKVKETMEKAFWDTITESLKEDITDYTRIVALVKEVRDELFEMAPQKWKNEILDSIDLDILSQVLETGAKDTIYLGRILEYALLMVQKLSAPAKEAQMKKAHNEVLNELTSIAQSGKQINFFFIAVIKGLRFVLEETQTLKQEISKARIRMMEPIIKGSTGIEYLQKAFADRYGPPTNAAESLPLCVQWISSLKDCYEEEWEQHSNNLSPSPSTQGLPTGVTLRTGGSIPIAQRLRNSQNDSGSEEQPECSGENLDILLRLGLLKLVNGIEGLTNETVPETLELNVSRLRLVQSQLQQTIVVSTSMLVLRQILVSENLSLSSEIEKTISNSFNTLFDLLDHVPDSSIEDIVNAITSPSSFPYLENRKEIIARMLTKSLQSEDAVFLKVSHSIYLAARALVLGGTSDRGKKHADVALRRVGAAVLADRLVKVAEVVIVVARVSGQVHEPWYRLFV